MFLIGGVGLSPDCETRVLKSTSLVIVCVVDLPQYKELQQALEMERVKKRDLQQQLTKTKAELQVARMEGQFA